MASQLPKMVYEIHRIGTNVPMLKAWVDTVMWESINSELPRNFKNVRFVSDVSLIAQDTYGIYPKMVGDEFNLTDWPRLRNLIDQAIQRSFTALSGVTQVKAPHFHDDD